MVPRYPSAATEPSAERSCANGSMNTEKSKNRRESAKRRAQTHEAEIKKIQAFEYSVFLRRGAMFESNGGSRAIEKVFSCKSVLVFVQTNTCFRSFRHVRSDSDDSAFRTFVERFSRRVQTVSQSAVIWAMKCDPLPRLRHIP